MAETYYDVLEVGPDASDQELRRAFRRAARRWSPDHNPAPEAHERMVRVNEAGDHLLDPHRRSAYDRKLHHGPAGTVSAAPPTDRAIRVVPPLTHVGLLFEGDSRLVEIDIYVNGPEPLDIAIDPESGDGWRVDEVVRPDDGSGRFLSVRILVQTHGLTTGAYRGHVDLSFDGDDVRAVFMWEVRSLLPATPPSASYAAASSTAPPPRPAPPAPPAPGTTTPFAPPTTSRSSGAGGGLPPLLGTTPTTGRPNDQRVGVLFVATIGATLLAWAVTPILASVGSLFIPGLSAAVFAPSEHNGRSAGDAPIRLYQHLATTLILFDEAFLVLALVLGTHLTRWWPIALGVLSGLFLFFWLVVTQGGVLWQWDILPITTLLGFVSAQLLTRRRATTHSRPSATR